MSRLPHYITCFGEPSVSGIMMEARCVEAYDFNKQIYHKEAPQPDLIPDKAQMALVQDAITTNPDAWAMLLDNMDVFAQMLMRDTPLRAAFADLTPADKAPVLQSAAAYALIAERSKALPLFHLFYYGDDPRGQYDNALLTYAPLLQAAPGLACDQDYDGDGLTNRAEWIALNCTWDLDCEDTNLSDAIDAYIDTYVMDAGAIPDGEACGGAMQEYVEVTLDCQYYDHEGNLQSGDGLATTSPAPGAGGCGNVASFYPSVNKGVRGLSWDGRNTRILSATKRPVKEMLSRGPTCYPRSAEGRENECFSAERVWRSKRNTIVVV